MEGQHTRKDRNSRQNRDSERGDTWKDRHTQKTDSEEGQIHSRKGRHTQKDGQTQEDGYTQGRTDTFRRTETTGRTDTLKAGQIHSADTLKAGQIMTFGRTDIH